MQISLLWAALAAATLLYSLLFARLATRLQDFPVERRPLLLLSGLASALLFFACGLGLPMAIFLPLQGLNAVLPLRLVKAHKSACFLNAMVHFTLLCTLCMSALGLASLLQHSDPFALWQSPVMRLGILTLVVVLLSLHTMLALFFTRLPGELFRNAFDYRQAHMLLHFLRCAILYVFVDAVICLFPYHTELSATLLFCGSSLLTLLVVVFNGSNLAFMRSRFYEDRYFLELTEHARQEYQTLSDELLSSRDSLTGAYTRACGRVFLDQAVAQGAPFALVFLDLDGLKAINDTQGHSAGDLYLQRFAQELMAALSHDVRMIRYGGDEFLLMMPGRTATEAEDLLTGLVSAAPYSFGAVDYAPGKTREGMLQEADAAMYRAKRRKKARRAAIQGGAL